MFFPLICSQNPNVPSQRAIRSEDTCLLSSVSFTSMQMINNAYFAHEHECSPLRDGARRHVNTVVAALDRLGSQREC